MAPKRRTELDSLDLEVFGGPLDPATVALERDGPFVDPDTAMKHWKPPYAASSSRSLASTT
jgi:hypothetical protein